MPDAKQPIELKNSFRKELEEKEPHLSAVYTMEVESEDDHLEPTRKVFTVNSAKITETLNVIRRLLTGPPPRTRLIAFTIIPRSFNASDVMEHAHCLSISPLAKPFFNETNPEIETKAEPAADQFAETDEDGGVGHITPSGVVVPHSFGGQADPQS
jgi:hypothetical protein